MKEIIGILICMLLIANISDVLDFPEEQIKTIKEEKSITLVDPPSRQEVTYNFN